MGPMYGGPVGSYVCIRELVLCRSAASLRNRDCISHSGWAPPSLCGIYKTIQEVHDFL